MTNLYGVIFICIASIYGHGSARTVPAQSGVELGQTQVQANTQTQLEKQRTISNSALMNNAIGNGNKMMNIKANNKQTSANALRLDMETAKNNIISRMNNAKLALINSMKNANNPMNIRTNVNNVMNSRMVAASNDMKTGPKDNSVMNTRMNIANNKNTSSGANDKNAMNSRMANLYANNAMYMSRMIQANNYAMMMGMKNARNAMLYNRMNQANYAMNPAMNNAMATGSNGMDPGMDMGPRRRYNGFGSRFNNRFNDYASPDRGSMMAYGGNFMTPSFGLPVTSDFYQSPSRIYSAMLPFLLAGETGNQIGALSMASNPSLASVMTMINGGISDGAARAILIGQMMNPGQDFNLPAMLALSGNDVLASLVAQQKTNGANTLTVPAQTASSGINSSLLRLILASQAMQ